MSSPILLHQTTDYLNTDFFNATVKRNIDSFLRRSAIHMLTSGSTGVPKRIEIPYESVIASINATASVFNLKTDDIALLCLNPDYIGGLMMVLRAIHLKMKLICVPPSRNPLSLINHSIDFMACVPLQVQSLIEDGEEKVHAQINTAKAIIIGGAPVSAKLTDQIIALKLPAYSTYGMTETVSHIAIKNLRLADSSYEVIQGIETGVDDDDCLWVRGQVTSHKKIQTNDIVRFKDKNSFEWLGRRDNVINSGGLKIIPEALETSISQANIIQEEFFIYGLPDPELGQRVALFIASEPKESTFKENFIKKLSEKINRYQLPKEIIFIKTFEYTASGKVQRSKTVEEYIRKLNRNR